MHGRKKPTREETAEERSERLKKYAKYKKLSDTALALCAKRSMTEQAFQLNAKMVAANPDSYAVWNHRREMLTAMLEDASEEKKESIAANEAALTAACLAKRNPKSYCAWFQRKWLAERGLLPLDRELQLCKKMLTHDERNFHCWNYRRWVAAKANVSPEAELEFTKEKILYNFSNYSAWHYRSKLLPQISELTPAVLQAELEFLQDAMFTEPADQSLWMYHRWLLAGLGAAQQKAGSRDDARALLQTQADQCAELADAMEEDGESSKWPRLAQAYILRLLASGTRDEAARDEQRREATALLTSISAMDPTHKSFYAYAATNQTPMLGDLAAADSS